MPLHQQVFSPTPDQVEAVLHGPLHDKAISGITLFNHGEYWEAHEALEIAWLQEESILRGLYKGILQAGVMYLQIQRENLKGAMKMYMRNQVWLAPWPDWVRGVPVAQLRQDIEVVKTAAVQLGKDNLHKFDPSLFKSIKISKSSDH